MTYPERINSIIDLILKEVEHELKEGKVSMSLIEAFNTFNKEKKELQQQYKE